MWLFGSSKLFHGGCIIDKSRHFLSAEVSWDALGLSAWMNDAFIYDCDISLCISRTLKNKVVTFLCDFFAPHTFFLERCISDRSRLFHGGCIIDKSRHFLSAKVSWNTLGFRHFALYTKSTKKWGNYIFCMWFFCSSKISLLDAL